jgi:hypothetical protein
MKDQPENKRSLDGDVRVDRLAASLSVLWRCPRVDGILAEPESNISSLSKGLLILRPVLDTIGCLFALLWASAMLTSVGFTDFTSL